ncbi:hypothetical protein [Nocardioides pakistanensis]
MTAVAAHPRDMTVVDYPACGRTAPAGVSPTPLVSEDDVIAAVALHAAAAEPATDLHSRERRRARYAASLDVIWLPHDPDFALAWVRGAVPCDAAAWAVHLGTGAVFDPDPSLATSVWLAQIRDRMS